MNCSKYPCMFSFLGFLNISLGSTSHFSTWSKTLAYENIPVSLWTELLTELWAYSFGWKISSPLSSYHCLAEALALWAGYCRPLSIWPTNVNWKTFNMGHTERWPNDEDPPTTHSQLSTMPYFNRKIKSWPFTNRQSGRSMFWNRKCFTSKTDHPPKSEFEDPNDWLLCTCFPRWLGRFSVIVSSTTLSFTVFWTVYKLRAPKVCFLLSFLVGFVLVSRLCSHGCPVLIILLPNKVHGWQAWLFYFKN